MKMHMNASSSISKDYSLNSKLIKTVGRSQQLTAGMRAMAGGNQVRHPDKGKLAMLWLALGE